MAGELEAIGDAVTGGLAARAVEPGHGEGHGHGARSCLNCGTGLVGAHCHNCGQAAHVHRSVAAIWHDIAHGVLHFEGKIWRTLPLLVFQPGKLTRRYIDGERARFVSPMAMFLFTVFFAFATVSILGVQIEAPGAGNMDAGSAAERSVKASRADLRAAIARLDGRIAEAERAGRDTRDLEQERVRISGILRFMEGGPSVLSGADTRGQLLGFQTGWDRLDKGIAKANENPNLLLYKLQNNAYKFSWALIPISVPFLWLLFFWRRRFHVYDHAVFVTYSLSFMTLLGIVLTVFGSLGVSSDLLWLAVLAIPIHMYKQLKYGYALSRFSATWRTLMLLVFATMATVAFVLLLFTLGLVG